MSEERREGVKFVFDCNVIDSLGLFKLVLDAFKKIGLAENFLVRGADISASELEAIILKKKNWPSEVVSNGVRFLSGMLPSRGYGFLEMKGENSWEEVPILEFFQNFVVATGFVQAWVYDIEYDFWQNAKDPLEYEAAGRSSANLPKISNGLPPPLSQLEIDTSQNP